MHYIRRYIILLITAIFVFSGHFVLALEDGAVLAVKKDYLKRTGRHWNDASDKEQKKFLENFRRKEKMLTMRQRLRKVRSERRELMRLRDRHAQQRVLDRKKRDRERKASMQKREFERSKMERKRKMQQAKQKLKRLRSSR